MLFHYNPDPHSELSLRTDASQVAVGDVLQQISNGIPRPLAFFSRNLQPAQMRYSTFSREWVAVYLSIKHFRHFLEGKQFVIFTDHKPLTFAFWSKTDSHSPRKARQLDFVSQFTSDIRYINGPANFVADALSISSLHYLSSPFIDSSTLALAQDDSTLSELRSNPSLQFHDLPLLTDSSTIACDISTGCPGLYIPLNFRRKIFDHFHSISHTSIRATVKLISDSVLWPNLRKDIRFLSRNCLHCQSCKLYRHSIRLPERFSLPDSRFQDVHIDLVGPSPPSNGFSYIFTCVDRYTRWLVATPIRDISAETVVRSFWFSGNYHYWPRLLIYLSSFPGNSKFTG